jgi:N-acetyl-gamma-glutamyl-phosphate reductase
LFFLALPHGTASTYAIPLLEAGKKVIDLSADFRLNSSATYEEFYGSPHPSPEWLKKASYGLPEIHSLSWENSSLIASPGCYPTSIIVPLFPILKNRLIDKENIIANSLSGVSGAGRNATEKLLFCERNESACAYGLPKHRPLIGNRRTIISSNCGGYCAVLSSTFSSNEQRNLFNHIGVSSRWVKQIQYLGMLE